MVQIYQNPDSTNIKPIFALIGTDKQGKGTTWRHTLYGLSKLRYKVLGVTFPSYNTVGGMGAEINLSHKQIIDLLPSLGVDTAGWSKSKYAQIYSYILDRGMATQAIIDHVNQGYVVVTKRSSKATHAAYQKAFNNIPERTTMQLEPFVPDPSVIMNMLSKGIRVDDFSEKGSSVLDDFESQNQDPVAKIQDKYTRNPKKVGARYGFHIPYEESPQRLDTILEGLTTILSNNPYTEKVRDEEENPIKILGREEAKWDFRTKEGLENFLTKFTGADLLESWFSHPFEIANSYEDLFRINGKLLDYPMSVKEEIDQVIEQHMNSFKSAK
ncbi:MAG: hypothetical protein KC535_03740 [Nanoarchaeota archaeon]|nr:hypothetical protein [Nanoarchaeota archaeon]